ncbi:hypothetical protein AX17_006390 [Amanita inopinata Kibby_2008]|nr:hypothetical protein AX17_006390 [Amanita inopinata Kibby_2008]
MSNYAALGISPDASDDQVRSAYKRKALECHPDRHVKDKDVATRNFIEINNAYRAILRERRSSRRSSTGSHTPTSTSNTSSSTSSAKSSSPSKTGNDHVKTASSKASPKANASASSARSSSASGSSTHSFSSSSFSASSSPASTPSSSPFSTPSSSPYTTPASSPGSTPTSSTASLPTDKNSTYTSSSYTSYRRASSCEVEEDGYKTSTGKPPPDPSSTSTPPKAPRTKLRKQQPKPSQKPDMSHDYECDSSAKPTYSTSSTRNKPPPTSPPKVTSDTHSHKSKNNEIEIPEYLSSQPPLEAASNSSTTGSHATADLPQEWIHPLNLTLEDLFHGKRLCFRITRRYLSGKTKGVVLDVDIPAGCRVGTKILFRDAGHERLDGMRQDVVFVIGEIKHKRFVRGCEWDGGGGNSNTAEKESNKGASTSGNGEAKRNKRKVYYGEDDLVMEVRLPWVDRLKDEKAKVVVMGVDGKELVFEVDCRGGRIIKDRDRDKEKGKMTGVYLVEGAGMPVRDSSVKHGSGDSGKDTTTGASKRGKLFVRWEVFYSTSSSSSKWESFKQMFKFGK